VAETQNDEPAEYLSEHVHAALAADPRVSELGIQVTISGNKVFLSGDVATDARRDAVAAVAAEVLPDHEVHNHVAVVERRAGGGREDVR
jgi:osmotically-inducible protein OsmY